jgi:hypothetical protein
MYLARHGRADIAELIDALSRFGFEFAGRPSKAISDARGMYGPGSMPRSTEYRIHQRELALRDAAERYRAEGG